MKLISVILFFIMFEFSLANAEQIDIESYNKSKVSINQDLIDSIEKVKVNKMNIDFIINQSGIVDTKPKTKKEKLEDSYNIFNAALSNLNEKKYFQNFLDEKFDQAKSNLLNNDIFTLIYFVDKNVSYASIKKFIVQFEILKTHYSGVSAKVFLNNYPENFVDSIKDKIEGSFKENKISTKFGSLSIKENGSYVFTINKLKISPKTRMHETIKIVDTDSKEHKVRIEFIANKDSVLKIIGKFSMDSMVRYLNELKDYGVKSKNVSLHVHPWAFKAIKLKTVPSMLLAKCNYPDFSFRRCEKKYLISGNVELEYFFKTITENDKSYGIYYNAIISGNKE